MDELEFEVDGQRYQVTWVRLGESSAGGDWVVGETKYLGEFEVLRFDLNKWDEAEQEFEFVDDTSYATLFPAEATEEQKEAGLRYLAGQFTRAIESGGGLKKWGERLSWIGLDWLEEV